MIKALGRKKFTSQSEWERVWKNIENYVTRAEVLQATEKAVEDIKRTTQRKRVAYSWSGGKDSIVLADVCKKAGIDKAMFAHTELEYPEFLKWCKEHLPQNCEVINLGYDLDWLLQHPNMLFPNKKDYQRYMVVCQRKAFTKYFFSNKLDMLIVGHRKADGNIVGENNILKKQSGEVRYSPLADWSHELLLAYIHYNNLAMPPIYGWKDGFKQGTHCWAGRQGIKTPADGWREIYEISPEVVIKAAEKIESARLFLNNHKGEN